MSKLIRFYETGGAEVLKIENTPPDVPGEGEVRLKVEAIGLNRAEIMFREGQYLEEPAPPSKLGYEASGVIDAIGPDVKTLKVGDRVSTIPSFSMGKYGVYGENPVVPAYAVAAYPDNLSAIEGASIWMQFLTAFGALIEYAKLSAEDSVLITAASSSVGVAAIQVAKSVGAKVIAATRTEEKKKFLLEAGADHVIVTNSQDLAAICNEITSGNGVNVVFDPIGGPIIEELANAAAPGGIIFEYGALSTDPSPFPLFTALGKGLSIRGYTLFEITQDPIILERGKQFIYLGLESGKLKPVIDRTFAFDSIIDAHKYMEKGDQMGKIVITV